MGIAGGNMEGKEGASASPPALFAGHHGGQLRRGQRHA
jgi:hypothetical protein